MSISSELDQKVKQYILDCIDLECYEETAETAQEAALKVVGFIMKEADNTYNRKKLVSDQAIIADHIVGLPSYLNIAFSNYDILQLAVKWGSIPVNAIDKQEQKILDNYFNLIASKLLQISRGHNVKNLIWGKK